MAEKDTDRLLWRVILVFIALVVIGGFLGPLVKAKFTERAVIEQRDDHWNSYTNTVYDIQLVYPVKYDLVELDENTFEEYQQLEIFLYDNIKHEMVSENLGQQEKPPGITLEIFENVEGDTVREWLFNEAHSSSTPSRDQIVSTHIGGEDAFRYRLPELGETEFAVVTHDKYIYVFTASIDTAIEEDPFDLFHIILQRVTFPSKVGR